MDLEELELELIDYGVDELEADEEEIVAYGDSRNSPTYRNTSKKTAMRS